MTFQSFRAIIKEKQERFFVMKYCTHCGQQIEDDAFICVHCGCKVSQEVSAENTTTPHARYCTYCGATLNDGADVCLNCGRKVEKEPIVQQNSHEKSNNTLTTIAKVFMILTCVGCGMGGLITLINAIIFTGIAFEVSISYFVFAIIYLIPLAWDIPLTVHVFKASKENAPIATATKVCILIFVNIVSGILLLCRTESNRNNN